MQKNDIHTPPPGSDEAAPLTASGDLALTSGLTSLRLWTLRAAVVPPGGIPHRPDFGVGIDGYLGKNTLEAQARMQAAYRKTLLADRRIKDARVGVRQSATAPGRTDIWVRYDTVDGQADEVLPLEAR